MQALHDLPHNNLIFNTLSVSLCYTFMKSATLSDLLFHILAKIINFAPLYDKNVLECFLRPMNGSDATARCDNPCFFWE